MCSLPCSSIEKACLHCAKGKTEKSGEVVVCCMILFDIRPPVEIIAVATKAIKLPNDKQRITRLKSLKS